ncbi:DUF5998 family protein [Actinomadura geliboluensis]|uniref:DUF5998 family protein n=1 Tax=Actinomadura geliboluensis TaxID=882440 RepID=UPI001F11255F|nr:DUF5998 family protein [Actinomadura geliboluensis]
MPPGLDEQLPRPAGETLDGVRTGAVAGWIAGRLGLGGTACSAPGSAHARCCSARVVHHEATFDPAMEVRRHVTVLVLSATRLLVCHTDEHPPGEGMAQPHASTTTEAVKLERVQSVAVTRVVPDPASYVPGVPPTEVVLTIGWGAIAHIDLEPATCGDENCEADHGYTGSVTADDLSLRVSEAADGADAVTQVLAFAEELSAATAR